MSFSASLTTLDLSCEFATPKVLKERPEWEERGNQKSARGKVLVHLVVHTTTTRPVAPQSTSNANSFSQCCSLNESSTGCCSLSSSNEGTSGSTNTTPGQPATTGKATKTKTSSAPPFSFTNIPPQGPVSLNYQNHTQLPLSELQWQDVNATRRAEDEVFRNICGGLQNREGGLLKTQTDTLTYNRSAQVANRRAACKSPCETGSTCLELSLSIQGAFLAGQFLYPTVDGTTYTLSVNDINCLSLLATSPRPSGLGDGLRKRQDIEGPTPTSHPNITGGLSPVMQYLALSFVIDTAALYYIGDLPKGVYQVNLQVNTPDGQLLSFGVIDYEGHIYASTSNDPPSQGISGNDPPMSLPFTLDQDATGVTLMLTMFSPDLALSGSLFVGTSPTKIPRSPVSTPTQTSGASAGVTVHAADPGLLGVVFASVVGAIFAVMYI
ncbi:hypothetical protein CPC08DRAFT_763518 [Agrocybe pediades]|nr:hypothetical protein CPC08DRAFT_763518 [Agrocybe pediades]